MASNALYTSPDTLALSLEALAERCLCERVSIESSAGIPPYANILPSSGCCLAGYSMSLMIH